MNRLISFALGLLLTGAFASAKDFEVSGQPLPTSIGSPTTAQGESLAGPTLNMRVTVLILSNTDTSTHTVTVQDCQGTPFKLFPALTIPAVGSANSTWILSVPNGFRMQGCFKWVSDSALVMGTIVGTK